MFLKFINLRETCQCHSQVPVFPFQGTNSVQYILTPTLYYEDGLEISVDTILVPLHSPRLCYVQYWAMRTKCIWPQNNFGLKYADETQEEFEKEY